MQRYRKLEQRRTTTVRPGAHVKVLVLQKYHGLSDEATEAQINDRLTFLAFLGSRLGDEVPSANTIWNFKEPIEKDGRNETQKLFDVFHGVLDGEGLIGKDTCSVKMSEIDARLSTSQRSANQAEHW